MALQKKRKVFEDESILPDNIGKDWSNLLLSGNVIFLRSRHFSRISHLGRISCILINSELRLNFDMNSKMKIKYFYYHSSGRHSDVVIINGDARIPAHFLVLDVRCEKICNDIIEVKGIKYLETWSHLTKNVVESFLSYVYSGIIDIELVSHEDLESAKYFCKTYPNLYGWKLFIEKNYIDQTQL